jgi:hypothetical protein
MIFRFIPALLCITTSITILHAQKVNTASWNNNAKTIDGILNDWAEPIKFTSNQAGFQMAFSNDSMALYVALKVTDHRMQMKMMREGLRLFIDGGGKKSESRLVEYPLPLPPPKASEGGPDRPDTFAMKKRVLQNLNTFGVSGMNGIPNGNLQPGNPYDVEAAAAWDSLGQMTLEYQLPLKYFDISVSTAIISMGLFLPGSNAMDGFMPPPPGEMGGGPGGEAMGGPPPGGDMDGGPPPGMNPFNDSNREYRYWTKLKLAQHP